MSYDVTREELAQTLAQERLNYVAMKRERDANWEALDRLRSRLREIVPDVPEGGDLVAAIQRKLSAPSPPETPAAEGRGIPIERLGEYLKRGGFRVEIVPPASPASAPRETPEAVRWCDRCGRRVTGLVCDCPESPASAPSRETDHDPATKEQS